MYYDLHYMKCHVCMHLFGVMSFHLLLIERKWWSIVGYSCCTLTHHVEVTHWTAYQVWEKQSHVFYYITVYVILYWHIGSMIKKGFLLEMCRGFLNLQGNECLGLVLWLLKKKKKTETCCKFYVILHLQNGRFLFFFPYNFILL